MHVMSASTKASSPRPVPRSKGYGERSSFWSGKPQGRRSSRRASRSPAELVRSSIVGCSGPDSKTGTNSGA
jgi:hypothetical protein